MGYRYASSVVTSHPRFPDEVADLVRAGRRTGARVPHAWLDHAAGRSTIDLFGRAFVALVATDDPAPLADAGARPRVPLKVHALAYGAAARAYDIADVAAVLVRPDGHVAWRSPAGVPVTPELLGDAVRAAAGSRCQPTRPPGARRAPQRRSAAGDPGVGANRQITACCANVQALVSTQ